MFSHRSFLLLSPNGAADIMSLIKSGYEIAKCNLSFEQGFDDRGKAETRVFGGAIHLTLPMIPPQDIIDWSMKSRRYKDGVIVLVDHENVPLEKIYFNHAACIAMELDYIQKGSSYFSTKLTIQAESIVVGDGIDFQNEWKY